MAVIFEDAFVESANTPLTSHAPTVGTSWVEEENTTAAAAEAQVVASVDQVNCSATVNSSRIIVTSRPNPASVAYDVTAEISQMTGTGSDDPLGLIGRLTDTSNYYATVAYQAGAAADAKIYGLVSGSLTELASGDTGWVSGDIMKFEIRDAAKKLYKNGAEVLSTTNNDLTSAGRAGMCWGNVTGVSTDDVNANQRFDDYSVDEISTGATMTPGAGALAITGLAMALAFGHAVPAGAVAFTGQAPSVRVDAFIAPATGGVGYTGYVPTVSIGGTNVAITVGAGAVAIVGQAPAIAFQGPGAGQIVWIGLAPTLQVNSHFTVTPGVGSLRYTGAAPTVQVNSQGVIALGVGALGFTGSAPTVQATAHVAVDVPGGSVSVVGQAPSLSTGIVLTLGAGALAFSAEAVSVGQSYVVMPAAGHLAWTGGTAVLVFGTDVVGVIELTGSYRPIIDLTGGFG